MRVSAVIIGAFAALGSATSSSTAATTTTSVAAQSSAQAAITKCLDACMPGDVNCTSKCIAVPNPDAAQVNATNTCVANCPKGKGTASDNQNYATCVNNCISDNYYTSTGTPAGATGSGSDSGSGTNTAGSPGATGSDSGTGTGGSSASGTGSAGASTTSKAAGEALRVGTSAAGLLGFLAAFVAL